MQASLLSWIQALIVEAEWIEPEVKQKNTVMLSLYGVMAYVNIPVAAGNSEDHVEQISMLGIGQRRRPGHHWKLDVIR